MTNPPHAEAASPPAEAVQPASARPRLLQVLSVFGVCVVLLGFIQFSIPGLSDNDGYYHIKLAWLMRQELSIKPTYTWTPLTIANEKDFYDNHMLFHVYLAAFANSSPDVNNGRALVISAKVAIVLLTSVAFTAFWWLLQAQGFRYPLLWTIGLFAVSDMFLFRMSMVRAQTPSLLLMLLGLQAIFQRRYRWLFPLGVVYVWMYDAFPLFMTIIIASVAADICIERRLEWRGFAYAVGGIIAGLVINPYFPKNILFIVTHIGPKIANETTDVGLEWLPFDTWVLLEHAGIALALFLGTMVALITLKRGFSRVSLIGFFLSLGFCFMMFKSKRFIEYVPPFILLFAAASLSPILADEEKRSPALIWRVKLIAATAFLMATITTLSSANTLMQALGIIKPYDLYQDSSAWLKANTPKDSIVYNTFWGDFTYMFFHNTSNRYVLGLEPTYMDSYDPELYKLYVDINNGAVANPSGLIKSRFQSDYVVADIDETRNGQRDAFLKQAFADPNLKEVYRDKYAIIFQVLP
ncbi:MAG TPA: hypothetical protein VGE07_15765 [Herpetosiphonaceae bacterium]